ncbi:PP2C family protein-serine/threonine phosphatase [Acidicapsa acidisoli]|uniref:PP2C family protein-serine/threonine phosphatase n=1 Tax=Acidicapsa acidisoli TaxID=1615681 RepID=UPI0021DF64D5|nr:SpoIIE family protein phosphatase [Acidicapsa acidisoli]
MDGSPVMTQNSITQTMDLQQQVARLQALLEVSRQVHSTTREDEVLETVLRIVVRELEMAGAAFSGTDLSYGDPPKKTEAGKVDGIQTYPLDDREGKRMTDLIVAPPEGRPITMYETDFLEGLALQAAVALENARNHERNLQWARVQQDLDAAREIQRSLLPQRMPSIPGFSIAVKSQTCYEVGGDYVDIISLPEGGMIMAVADVAGKGLASAIMATSFRAAFRAMAITGVSLDLLATRMNQHHWQEGEEARRRYVTAIFLRLDPRRGEVEIVNAGHNPGFVITPDGASHQIEAAGTPLGLLPGMTYSSERLLFAKGSRLLFYTDGLTEVFLGDEEFGQDRLLKEFCDTPVQQADGILDALWRAIQGFSGGGPQEDDMTALVLCHLPEVAPSFADNMDRLNGKVSA